MAGDGARVRLGLGLRLGLGGSRGLEHWLGLEAAARGWAWDCIVR